MKRKRLPADNRVGPNPQDKMPRLPADNKRRLTVPLELWPDRDRQLWEAGVEPVDRLDLRRSHRHADTLRPQSIENARKSYGRFLNVLDEAGLLTADQGPAERVTPETVALFFDALRGQGNLDNSIKAQLFGLRVALRIMVPEVDFPWITRPGNRSLDSLLCQKIDDDIELPEFQTLRNLAKTMMDEAIAGDLSLPGAWLRNCRHYRNGMIIAIFAERAPRLGSLALMRVGINLFRTVEEWWVRLEEQIVKNKRLIEYSLPPELSDYMTHYMRYIRPTLLDPLATDAVWGNGDGSAFTKRSIQTMINRVSKTRLGRGFGPHLLRKVLTTELSKRDPGNPGLAASILGISVAVADTYYRRHRQETAALKFHKNLAGEQRRTRKLARRPTGTSKPRA